MFRILTLLLPATIILVLAGCSSTPSGPRVDNLPMYGQPALVRPEFLKKADSDFVANAVLAFGGDRKLASSAWAQQADRFLDQGNLDYAMRRYNQAWLLDEANYEAYWGFGRVAVETDKFDEGIRFMQKAIELCRDDYQLAGIFSDLGVAHSYKADSQRQASERSLTFSEANKAFTESVRLSSKNGNAWRRWSMSLVMEGKYVEAADKLSRAKQLGARSLPPEMLKKITDTIGPIEK